MRYKHLTEKRGYTGFELPSKTRKILLSKLPPKHADVIAHHITYKFGVGEDSVPSVPKTAEIVGYASDDSLEAYVVAINGSTTRPDGKVYHVTWSLDKSKGRKPVQSNNLLANGWAKIEPIKIEVTPKFFTN
ncbi:MAG: hypothetical protein HC836_23355 [Richelia sp. RM2_1_2]|nr:hypothetical protein [Richelia sp. RM2_1_2]